MHETCNTHSGKKMNLQNYVWETSLKETTQEAKIFWINEFEMKLNARALRACTNIGDGRAGEILKEEIY